jgi:hypothetical protein
MAQLKYSAGQRVALMRGVGFSVPAGSYRVVGALPREAGPQQYRIRNDNEMFDRIVDEARLEAAVL